MTDRTPPLKNIWPCASKPQEQRCDHAGPGGFMGHTCGEPLKAWDGTWVEGDIFRWEYTAEVLASFTFASPHHCVSHLGMVRGGRMWDTYWYTLSSGKSFSLEEAQQRLTLTWLGNADVMEVISHTEVKYYDPADVIDMTHSNCSSTACYVRRGAQRSIERYRALLHERREEAKSQLRIAISRLEDCARIEEQLRQADVKLEEVGL